MMDDLLLPVSRLARVPAWAPKCYRDPAGVWRTDEDLRSLPATGDDPLGLGLLAEAITGWLRAIDLARPDGLNAAATLLARELGWPLMPATVRFDASRTPRALLIEWDSGFTLRAFRAPSEDGPQQITRYYRRDFPPVRALLDIDPADPYAHHRAAIATWRVIALCQEVTP